MVVWCSVVGGCFGRGGGIEVEEGCGSAVNGSGRNLAVIVVVGCGNGGVEAGPSRPLMAKGSHAVRPLSGAIIGLSATPLNPVVVSIKGW